MHVYIIYIGTIFFRLRPRLSHGMPYSTWAPPEADYANASASSVQEQDCAGA